MAAPGWNPFEQYAALFGPPAPAPAPIAPLGQAAMPMFNFPAPPPLPPAPAPAPPPRFTGAGGLPTRAESIGNVGAASEAANAAAQRRADIQAARMAYEAEQQITALERQQREADEEAKRREEIQRRANERIQAVKAKYDAELEKEIDPDRYFKRRGTFGNILTLISVGLGSYASVKRGGRNTALDMLQHRLDQDIELQVRDHEKRLAALREERALGAEETAGELSALEFRVARTAETNTRVKAAIDAMAARYYGAPEVQAAAAEMKAARDADTAAKFETLRHTFEMEIQDEARTKIAGAAAAVQREVAQEQIKGLRQKRAQELVEQPLRLMALAREGAGKPADMGVLMPMVSNRANGEVRIKDEKEATRIKTAMGLTMNMTDKIDKLIKWRKEFGGLGKLTTGEQRKARKAAEEMVTSLAMEFSELYKQTNIRPGNWEVYEKIFGDPTDWGHSTAKLEAARDDIVGKINHEIEAQIGYKLTEPWDPSREAEERVKDLIDRGPLAGASARAGGSIAERELQPEMTPEDWEARDRDAMAALARQRAEQRARSEEFTRMAGSLPRMYPQAPSRGVPVPGVGVPGLPPVAPGTAVPPLPIPLAPPARPGPPDLSDMARRLPPEFWR